MIRVLALILLAGPVAAGKFTPPQGCTASLTVQSRSCVVEHLWTCSGDAAGMQWRAEMDQRGLVYVGQIDAEAQWVQSFFLISGEKETLISPASDPASFSALLAQGIDTYDFRLNTEKGIHRVVGFDRLADRNVVIDGEPLHRTEYSIRKTDANGQLIYEAEGSEFVSEIHGRFFSGTGDVTGPDTGYSYDSRPVDFIYPGEPGFLADTPLYGCDALAASYVTE